MKHTDSSHHSVPSPGWQILGELELTVNPDTDRTVGKWLGIILSPLALPADFLNQVLMSAQEAAMGAMQSETALKFEHTHLLVFGPERLDAKGQTWGFFRIEKIAKTGDGIYPDHTVEFYLYVGG
jgi:hypothetical protein